ncbi:ABC transporter ATP-binding protein [Sulfurospirillum sp. 1612]|uniref:ABC transporter ATP-binding protein n=1 Tax=Sulfurospirillum sp. 1612 TaxID=3094835 RepID=UPI002F937C91
MLVETRNVYKKFLGENVLDNISVDINHGDRIAMMGPNGAGKTTLIRAILGFYHIDKGSIRVNGHDPIKERVKVLKDISFIPQLPPPIKLNLDEMIAFIVKSSNISKEMIFEEALKMDLNIEGNLNKQFFKLSGGMKQKLLIAIALSKKSSLLIFDEPTANLDPKAREYFYNLLHDLDDSCSTLFITHRLDEIKDLVNRQIYMDLGKVVEDEKI